MRGHSWHQDQHLSSTGAPSPRLSPGLESISPLSCKPDGKLSEVAGSCEGKQIQSVIAAHMLPDLLRFSSIFSFDFHIGLQSHQYCQIRT
ncbi:hypothetical protein chiPu_0012156 [Chiloscyllium punctatum]|uniref:Uncharacterized protein n=1 Tax=Chiloscyllium punctatum TaxID=137246 RepID=A0A401STI9_CHIPU|nr:hypothetical protein [Chiloscyllium punctatum]